jgi:hypothetical protein
MSCQNVDRKLGVRKEPSHSRYHPFVDHRFASVDQLKRCSLGLTEKSRRAEWPVGISQGVCTHQISHGQHGMPTPPPKLPASKQKSNLDPLSLTQRPFPLGYPLAFSLSLLLSFSLVKFFVGRVWPKSAERKRRISYGKLGDPQKNFTKRERKKACQKRVCPKPGRTSLQNLLPSAETPFTEESPLRVITGNIRQSLNSSSRKRADSFVIAHGCQ